MGLPNHTESLIGRPLVVKTLFLKMDTCPLCSRRGRKGGRESGGALHDEPLGRGLNLRFGRRDTHQSPIGHHLIDVLGD